MLGYGSRIVNKRVKISVLITNETEAGKETKGVLRQRRRQRSGTQGKAG